MKRNPEVIHPADCLLSSTFWQPSMNPHQHPGRGEWLEITCSCMVEHVFIFLWKCHYTGSLYPSHVGFCAVPGMDQTQRVEEPFPLPGVFSTQIFVRVASSFPSCPTSNVTLTKLATLMTSTSYIICRPQCKMKIQDPLWLRLSRQQNIEARLGVF